MGVRLEILPCLAKKTGTALGQHSFDEPTQVIAFIRCECPGRTMVSNLGMAMKLSEMRPDAVYLSSCLVNAKPGCPYGSAEEYAKLIEDKHDIKVILGTHDYH